MTKETRFDKMKKLFKKIGHNIKRAFSALWRTTRKSIASIGIGLSATAATVVSIALIILLSPALAVAIVTLIIFELFHPNGIKSNTQRSVRYQHDVA